jgi:hypothetical protein
VFIQIIVFWFMTPCNLNNEYQSFREKCCFRPQCRNTTLPLSVACPYKPLTSSNEITRNHNSEDNNLKFEKEVNDEKGGTCEAAKKCAA